MFKQALEAARNLAVPFAPIVAARPSMEFIGVPTLLEPFRKSAIRLEQRFLFLSGQIEVRRSCRIG